MLETILFALLWFVLGVVATILGGLAFIAYCDHHGAYDDWTEEKRKEDTDSVLSFVNTLFPKK